MNEQLEKGRETGGSGKGTKEGNGVLPQIWGSFA